jgi:hypothetical protein
MPETHCVRPSDFPSIEKHWNDAYLKTPTESLGWYEKQAEPSLELIKQCGLEKDALIFNAGSGASTLIQSLLKEGYSKLVINDIAAAPLSEMRKTLEDWNLADLNFIVDDLTKPKQLLDIKGVDLWHDRAVLHFFTDEEEQKSYFKLIHRLVKLGGYVILAEFALGGAEKCCGLPVINYSSESLTMKMGSDFKLIKDFNYTYYQPSGDTREYIYTLFQRIA